MAQRVTEHCQPSILGRAVTEEELLRWEVERSREALALLRKKLGVTGIQQLLSGELAETDREHVHTVKESGGRWVASKAELDVAGLELSDFLQWLHGRVRDNDQGAMGRACPEHYVVTPTEDGRMDVIETTGGYGLPVRFLVKLGEPGTNVAPQASDVDPTFPVQMAGRGWLRSGQEMFRALHQFAETSKGFKAKLIIYFPSASPVGMVEGHR